MENQNQQLDPSFFIKIIGQKEVQLNALAQQHTLLTQENQDLRERLEKAEGLLQKEHKKAKQHQRKGGKKS
ncbi:hypothetical protein [Rossellomorea marisflavi]|uniref:Uncharacterized protein n=1 Tax=Rossellomorea marisflavi TaxID=189381 RepID=A0A165LZ67_9BACI|nr:hypothetical protein [Rossellomorea marisflavi]KZE53392.1 hypothetical protein AV649_11555 [Rossellomorea marisflavi]